MPNLEFQTAREIDLSGLSDPQVLLRTAELNRVLVIHDRKIIPYAREKSDSSDRERRIL
jgi:hypothetical protein